MWFYAPQKWWQVPGFLWRAWRAGQAEDRRRASAAEAPSRPATRPRDGRADYAEAVDQIRRQVAKMRPEKCCKGTVMVAGGRRHEVCSEDCEWDRLELLVANASVDAT